MRRASPASEPVLDRLVGSPAILRRFYALLVPIPLYLEALGLPDWQIGFVLGAFGVSFGALFAFLPLLAERKELASVGAAYGVCRVSIIATRILTGRLLDRPNRGQVILPALLVNAVGLAGFAAAATMPLLLANAALMGIGSGIIHPALIANCADRMPDTLRGRATASFYLAFDLGIGLGSLLLGLVLGAVGLTGLYLTASLVSIPGALTAPLLSGNQQLSGQLRTWHRPSPGLAVFCLAPEKTVAIAKVVILPWWLAVPKPPVPPASWILLARFPAYQPT